MFCHLTKILMLTCGAFTGPLLANGFSFADFTSPVGLTLIGSAAQSGALLQLTPDAPWASGAAIYNERQDVTEGFLTAFTFRLSSSSTPADGIVFLIENAAPWFNQPAGGALDYYGLPNSLAVEFDTWQNGPYADPNGNHIAVQSCGILPNTPDHSAGCTLGMRVDPGVLLTDGAPHLVGINYAPGSLSVAVDGVSTITVPLLIDTKLGLADGRAWVALAGATGGSSETADILNWSFRSGPNTATPEPATSLLVGLALVSLSVVRRR